MSDSAPRQEAPPAPDGAEEVSYPRRFSWPMRLLLAFLLVHIVGESLITLAPYKDFASDLDVRRMPYPLPTYDERQELRARATDDNPSPLTENVMKSADSVWEYHKPWPTADTRQALRKRASERRAQEGAARANPDVPASSTPAWVGDWLDGGRFALAWTGTRMKWQERLVGFDQTWPMFSPNVGDSDWVVRARLVYEDETERLVYSLADPEDVTRYRSPRLLSEKVLQYSLRLEKDETRRMGYCNLLAHRHATSESGSPLVKIRLIKVRYDYPAPTPERSWKSRSAEEVRAELEAQIGPPGWEQKAPFFEYDVATRAGKKLK